MSPDSCAAPFQASMVLMLGTRSSKGRSQPFVCASCRHKFSTMTRPPQSRPSSISLVSSRSLRQSLSATRPAPHQWGARHLSVSPPLCDSAQNGGSSQPSRFPGAFGGRAAGTWGSFASDAAGSSAGSATDGGLLPHEREARKQTRLSAPLRQSPPAAPQLAPPNLAPRPPMRTRGGFRRGSAEAQVNMSRSVLANVFNTDREPRSPPTPASWTNPYNHSHPGAPADVAAAAATSSTQPRLGLGLYNDRKVTVQESPRPTRGPGPPGPPQRQAWGSFGDRRAQTIEHVAQPAVRGAAAQPNDSFSSMLELSNARKQLPSKTEANDQDFWAELEDRFTSFKENGRNRREAVDAQGAAKQPQQGSLSPVHEANTRISTSGQDLTRSEAQRQRRQARFAAEDDTKYQNRTLKKSKKAYERDRDEQDDDDWDGEALYRWEQRQRAKAEKEARKHQHVQVEPAAVPIFLPEYISVSNLAQALKQDPSQFLRDMGEMGFENITPDTITTGDTAALVAMEYGFDPTIDTGSQRDLRPRPAPAEVSDLPERPPVVTIMGHVDHGKTTLLDWLRKSSVAAQEHGGITQHIGAFVVKMSGKPITFLDTPGHAAFLTMRQRGANVTDIVVLVVAADDGVMPQTIEALKHATAAKVPIVVAINKVDREDARIDQVKADLSRHGVEIEDYGGDVQVVCVSGKTGQGVNDLEESIVTLSEVLDVRSERDGMAEGWVLESSVKQDGKVATVLVKRGTLRPGDLIVAGRSWARIRLLRNEAGAELDEAPPGTPVELLGWRDLPPAGEQVLQAPDEGKAKSAVEYRTEMAEREESSLQLAEQEQRQREKAAAQAAAAGEEPSAESTKTTEPSGPLRQNFCVKADVVGSVEAVCSSILELGNHEVRARMLRSSAGQISEYDVDHAAASNSILVNFNMAVLPHIKQRAEAAKVKILDQSVIYHVVDDAKAALSALLPDTVSIRVLGEADIVQVFSINVKKRVFKNIAGCKVRNGTIKRSSRIKVLRKGRVIYDGHIETLKHIKKDVMEMGKGTECGIGLEGFQKFMAEDQIQTYEEIREKRNL